MADLIEQNGSGSAGGSGSSGGSGSGGGSGSPPPDPGNGQPRITVQAEAGTLGGGATIAGTVGGASGNSYVVLPGPFGLENAYNPPGGAASSVTFTFTVPETAWYTLNFRYINGEDGNAYRNMLIDGTDLPGVLSFDNRFSGESWGTSRDRLELSAGTHTITVSSDLGDEKAGLNSDDPEILLDQLEIVRGTSPSDQTSARSLPMNNGTDMVAITEAALLYQKDIEAFGPYLAQLRHQSDWNIDQIDYGTMWFRQSGVENAQTFAPYFDSTNYYDEHGIAHVDYGDYLPTGEALPIAISREYAMVPNQPLLVERWTLTNQNQVGDPLIEWDIMNALRLNADLGQNAVWDERREAWIVEMQQGTGSDPLYLAFGAFQETQDQSVGPDGEDVRGEGMLPFDGDPGTSSGGQGVVGGFEATGDMGGDDNAAEGQGLTLGMEMESINLFPTRPVEVFFYYTLAESLEELDDNIALALNPQSTTSPGSPTFWFDQTREAWDDRLREARDIPGTEPTSTIAGREAIALEGETLRDVTDPMLETTYLRSLVEILQSQQPEFGSFLASTNPGYQFKVWPRDSAATAIALDGAGLHDDAGRYWRWMASVEEDGTGSDAEQFPNGSFHTNYSFWNADVPIPFVEPEWDAQGLFLIGVYRHYEALVNAGRQEDADAFVDDPVIQEAFVDAAQFIATGIEDNGFGPPDLSIWEEFYLYNVFTQITYAQGLNAARLLADEIGRPDLEAGWAEGAITIRDAILRPTTAEQPGLWNEEDGYLIWGITPDGQLIDRQENSANLSIVTGMLDANDPRAMAQIANTLAKLSHETYGIARYEGDTFYSSSPYSPGGTYESRVDEPVWPQMTSYVGMAKEFQGDAAWTLGSLGWTAAMYGEGNTAPGEGVDWSTREPLPSTMIEPVTAGWYVQNLLNYTGQFDPRLPDDIYMGGTV